MHSPSPLEPGWQTLCGSNLPKVRQPSGGYSDRRSQGGGWLALAILLLWATACGSATQTPNALTPVPATTGAAAGKKMVVVATTTIIADLAKNVAGDTATVTSLLGPGVDPHTFQPAPRDSQLLASADLILENGLGYEEWLDQVIQNSGTKARRVVVSKGLTPRRAQGAGEVHDAASFKAEDDESDHMDQVTLLPSKQLAYDPHMWLDAQAAMKYVENIHDALVQYDIRNAAAYRANAQPYQAQLKELDTYLAQQANSIPKERRKLVTNHETFGYFAERYGFEVVGTVIPSVSAEAQPSAQDVARLVDKVKAQKVPAVFAESTVNPRLAEQIARDAGVKVVTTLYTDSLSETGKPADTYIKLMRYDMDEIVKALR